MTAVCAPLNMGLPKDQVSKGQWWVWPLFMSQMTQQYKDSFKNSGFAQMVRIYLCSQDRDRKKNSLQAAGPQQGWAGGREGWQMEEERSPDSGLPRLPPNADSEWPDLDQQLFPASQGNRFLILFSHWTTLHFRKAWTHDQPQSESNLIFTIYDNSISFASDWFVNKHTTHF